MTARALNRRVAASRTEARPTYHCGHCPYTTQSGHAYASHVANEHPTELAWKPVEGSFVLPAADPLDNAIGKTLASVWRDSGGTTLVFDGGEAIRIPVVSVFSCDPPPAANLHVGPFTNGPSEAVTPSADTPK